jgi:hypothetical protein
MKKKHVFIALLFTLLLSSVIYVGCSKSKTADPVLEKIGLKSVETYRLVDVDYVAQHKTSQLTFVESYSIDLIGTEVISSLKMFVPQSVAVRIYPSDDGGWFFVPVDPRNQDILTKIYWVPDKCVEICSGGNSKITEETFDPYPTPPPDYVGEITIDQAKQLFQNWVKSYPSKISLEALNIRYCSLTDMYQISLQNRSVDHFRFYMGFFGNKFVGSMIGVIQKEETYNKIYCEGVGLCPTLCDGSPI